jgi:negative regulator of sigma E activity
MRQAVHFKVVGGRQEDHTEVWLDAETRLPLRIRHRDRKGDIFDQIAISIETEPKP